MKSSLPCNVWLNSFISLQVFLDNGWGQYMHAELRAFCNYLNGHHKNAAWVGVEKFIFIFSSELKATSSLVESVVNLQPIYGDPIGWARPVMNRGSVPLHASV